MVKITKEEFDKLQPRCNCSCNKEIPWSNNFKYRGIPQFINGHQNVVRFKSKGYREKMSAVHKSKIVSEETRKRTSISKIGQYHIYPNLTPSETLSYILGVIKGDGCVYLHKQKRRSGKVILVVKSSVFRDSFSNALTDIGLHPYNIIQRDLIGTEASSSCFCKWYKNLSIDDIKKHVKGYEYAFLRGFYESEGSLYKTVPNKQWYCISICNTNKELIDLICYILCNYNIQYRLYTTKRTKGLVKGIMYNLKDKYTIHIGHQKNINKFLEIVTPCIKNKNIAI